MHTSLPPPHEITDFDSEIKHSAADPAWRRSGARTQRSRSRNPHPAAPHPAPLPDPQRDSLPQAKADRSTLTLNLKDASGCPELPAAGKPPPPPLPPARSRHRTRPALMLPHFRPEHPWRARGAAGGRHAAAADGQRGVPCARPPPPPSPPPSPPPAPARLAVCGRRFDAGRKWGGRHRDATRPPPAPTASSTGLRPGDTGVAHVGGVVKQLESERRADCS